MALFCLSQLPYQAESRQDFKSRQQDPQTQSPQSLERASSGEHQANRHLGKREASWHALLLAEELMAWQDLTHILWQVKYFRLDKFVVTDL